SRATLRNLGSIVPAAHHPPHRPGLILGPFFRRALFTGNSFFVHYLLSLLLKVAPADEVGKEDDMEELLTQFLGYAKSATAPAPLVVFLPKIPEEHESFVHVVQKTVPKSGVPL